MYPGIFNGGMLIDIDIDFDVDVEVRMGQLQSSQHDTTTWMYYVLRVKVT